MQTLPLTIWALTDNKPGHRNQMEGLLSAMSDLKPLQVEWIEVKKHTQGLTRLLTGKALHTKQLLQPQPDVLLAAGHRTHLQLLALKRSLKKPAVVLMKPSLPLAWFDLCLIPRHDKVTHANNVIETIGPINRVTPTTQRNSNTGLILLGGESRHFTWSNTAVLQQIQQIQANNPHIQWQIATSRRTPEGFLVLADSHLDKAKIITPEQASKDWLPETMQGSEHIWTTEDSVSMVYEAITSGANVGLIRLASSKPNRVTREMEQLLQEGRVSSLEHPVAPSLALPPLHEAKRCAGLLLQKLELI